MSLNTIYQASYTATAATTTAVATGLVTLHTVTIPKTTAGTLSFQDASSNVYFAFPASTIAGTYHLDMVCNNGLLIVQGSASDQVTTTWAKL